MEHRVEPLPIQVEQPAGLDQLESLVEEQRGVHGDPASHRPHRMGQDLVARGASPVGVPAQRASRSGEGQPGHLGGRPAAETLERRAVLAVDRHQLPAERERGTHQRPSHHQRLLVGERQAAAARQGRQRGGEPGGADDAVQHHVAVGLGDQPRRRVRPHPDACSRRRPLQPLPRVARNLGAFERQRLGTQPRRLLAQPLQRPTRRQAHHRQAVRVRGRDLERLLADRAGRSQHHQPPARHGTLKTTICR
jgi:hypothetical protein